MTLNESESKTKLEFSDRTLKSEDFKMGLQLSWLERTPDKREVGGSSPLKPTGLNEPEPRKVHNHEQQGKGPLKPIGLVIISQSILYLENCIHEDLIKLIKYP